MNPRFPLYALLGLPWLAMAQPLTNPVAEHYLALGEGYPAWTDRIAWHRVIDMSTYTNGATHFERFENARDELYALGGGVLYYPAGVYDFTDIPADGPNGRGLMLRSGVVIRGATPAGDRWARPNAGAGYPDDGQLDLPTRFVFGFTPRTGYGVTPSGETPRDWNLVGLIPSPGESLSQVSDVGVVWVHFVGASVFWGFQLDWPAGTTYATSGAWKAALVKPAWQNRVPDGTFPWDYFAGSSGSRAVVNSGAGPGRLVFGCVFEDSGPVNNVVMEGRVTGGKNFGPTGYWLQKFGARVQVYGSEVLVANNVFPKSTRGYLYRQTVGNNPNQSTDPNQWTNIEATVFYDYNYSTAVDINKELVNPYAGKSTVYFLPGVVVRDNYVFNHGRKGFNLSGRWMTIQNNRNERIILSGTVPSGFGPASGQAHFLTLDGYVQCKPGGPGDISDSLSRAFDLAGGPLWVDGNVYDAARSSVANDGEGILCQAHGGTFVYSWAVTRNAGPEYMAGYDVDHYGSLWAWNNAYGRTIGNMKAGALYDFAVAGNVSGSPSAAGTAYDPGGALLSCPGGAPAAPTGVDAAPAGDTVRVTYLDATTNEVGFRVDRRVGGGPWQAVAYRPRQSHRHGGNPEEWVDYTAPRGVPLQYRVVAVNCDDSDAGASAPTASVTIPALEAPEPARVAVEPEWLTPAAAAWESGYQDRLGVLAYARNPWNVISGNADPDDGKRVFTALLTEMWKVRNNPAALKNLVDTTGYSRVQSTYAGSFYKPFSVPPLTQYFLVARHIMEPVQRTYILNRRNSSTEWGYLSRFDGYMDPLYNPSLFNSENFNWMARLGGWLWVREFPEFDLGPRKGLSRAYFQTHLDNLTRALFNAGRVEWNSNNYWGHSFNPVLVLYDHAPDAKTRRQAKAIADWMLIEAALHHIDGFQAAADVRAKTNAHLPFAGGIWPFTYLYFIDDAYHPTYSTADVQAKIAVDYVGIVHWSRYRPPQVAIDLAQRKYPLPVEIQSAKPFYYLDHDNYADWAGATVKGRRFEFETVWQDENCLMASVATNRPDRNAWIPTQSGFFTEQGLWRLAVKGTNYGALQITGNSGSGSTTNGRHPYEQIGQYRTVMMRIVKGSNQLWITVPNQLAPETAAGNRLFIDMGHGVYAAFIPHNHTSYSVGTPGETHTQHFWNYNTAEFGGLVLEVGVQRDFGSYSNFKTAILNEATLSVPGADQLEYASPLGHALRMQFMPVTTMLLNPGQVDQNGNPLAERWWTPAGVTPRVWRDGVEVDFSTWDSYRVVHGPEIIRQEWGSGVLRAMAGGEGMEIQVDPVTAEPHYFYIGDRGAYDLWSAFLPEGQQAPDDDPFGENVPNLLRFALLGDHAPGFEAPSFFAEPGADHLFEVELRAGSGLRPQLSNDLLTWPDAATVPGAQLQITPLPHGRERLEATPPPNWSSAFFRLAGEP